MYKIFFLIVACAIAFAVFEKQKQAPSHIGAVPKQTIDKVTASLDQAAALADEKMKAAEEDAAK